jgi:hypothetical protein
MGVSFDQFSNGG